MKQKDMIILDGKEGGGQILRSALSLSAITGKPFKIENIRGNRNNPGLEMQHLTAVNAMKEICNAKVKGNKLKSKNLEFKPGKIKGGDYSFDIKTAGSSTLLLQTILPALVFEDKVSRIEVKGGTDTKWAVPSKDFELIFLDYLSKAGIETEFAINKYGFYPKGGGEVILTVFPTTFLREIDIIKRGKFESMKIVSYASENLKDKKVAERMTEAFDEDNIYTATKDIKYFETSSIGGFVHGHVSFANCKIGFTSLAEKGLKAEEVGKECKKKLFEQVDSDATADIFTADQLMIYMALKGSGFLKVKEITEHMRTNATTIEKFLDVSFTLKENSIFCKLCTRIKQKHSSAY